MAEQGGEVAEAAGTASLLPAGGPEKEAFLRERALASAEEQEKIAALREELKAELEGLSRDGLDYPHTTGDIWMLRVLRGNDSDIAKAAAWYRKSLEVRKEYELDKICLAVRDQPYKVQNLPFSEYLQHCHIEGDEDSLMTQNGDLLQIERGDVQWSVFMEQVGLEKYETWHLHLHEARMVTLDRLSRERGHLVKWAGRGTPLLTGALESRAAAEMACLGQWWEAMQTNHSLLGIYSNWKKHIRDDFTLRERVLCLAMALGCTWITVCMKHSLREATHFPEGYDDVIDSVLCAFAGIALNFVIGKSLVKKVLRLDWDRRGGVRGYVSEGAMIWAMALSVGALAHAVHFCATRPEDLSGKLAVKWRHSTVLHLLALEPLVLALPLLLHRGAKPKAAGQGELQQPLLPR